MKIYKFYIPADRWVQDPTDEAMSYKGCVAAAVAENATDARKSLERYAAERSHDGGWLRVAKIIEIPIVEGAVIAWAQV